MSDLSEQPVLPTATAEPAILPADPKPAAPSAKRWHKPLFFGLVAFFLLIGASFAGYAFAYSHKILPRTTVAGVDVGGMTREEAVAAVEEKERAFLASQLSVSYEIKTWRVEPAKLGLSFDNADALDQAYQYGKTGDLVTQVKRLVRSIGESRSYDVTLLDVPQAGKDYLAGAVLKDVERKSSETSLDFMPGRVTVVPGVVGKRLDYPAFGRQAYAAFLGTADKVTLSLQDFAPEVTEAMADPARKQAELLLASGWTVQADSKSRALDPKDIATWLGTGVDRDATGKAIGLKITLNDDALKKVLTDWGSEIQSKPVNAQIKGENGAISVVSEAKDGLSLDVDKTAAAVKAAMLDPSGIQSDASGRTIPASTVVTKAEIRSESLASLGIKELIGSATTDFSGSPTNRAINIGVGQRALNGSMVKDGEEFSTIGRLTPIDQTTGYVQELVISNGRTIPEYGGGLCQVSTTLFRAVLNAGLPVTSRTNHSYRVAYYERGVGPGLDATVYDPNPDFKWKNDTGHAVYIQSYVVGTKVTFELYGTKDGRISTISAPQILSTTPSGTPIYSNTDTLPKGTTKQIETAHDGAKTLVTYTVTRNGETIGDQKFYSTYVPWPAQYLVGTKE